MRKIWVVVILFIVILVGFIAWWSNGVSATNPQDKSEKVFVIPKGAAIRNIGNDLKEQGLIKDPVVFFLYLKKNGLDTSIQAGSYKLSPSMNLMTVVDTLSHGTIDTWVTIPEGYRSEEIAQVLKENIGTYSDEWVPALKVYEGYLFPDTYLIPKDADVNTVITIMNGNFDAKVRELGLDPESDEIEDIVTMASLIEREAITDDEKPTIASVITNRLNNGMALDIDATLQYVIGDTRDGKWWTVPLAADRLMSSPYNTYQNIGLPPGPIANPGLEAIRAAINPADTNYYFYIHDRSGKAHFARTLEEHNENVATYLR